MSLEILLEIIQFLWNQSLKTLIVVATTLNKFLLQFENTTEELSNATRKVRDEIYMLDFYRITIL
ncbi:hypothetical protein CR513_29498, partial [Mucuna pruriens]